MLSHAGSVKSISRLCHMLRKFHNVKISWLRHVYCPSTRSLKRCILPKHDNQDFRRHLRRRASL
jgi:hypothetical protein